MSATGTDPAPLPARQRPLLVYDGDCGFCNYSVDYWRELAGDAVDFRPYQEVGAAHPDIADQIRGGKQQAVGRLIGEVMKKSGGSADAKAVRDELMSKLT